jgi:hypothetical protein
MYDDVVGEPLPSEFLSILEFADDSGTDPQKKTSETLEPVEPAPLGRAAKSEPQR